jgi:hypothetical protein
MLTKLRVKQLGYDDKGSRLYWDADLLPQSLSFDVDVPGCSTAHHLVLYVKNIFKRRYFFIQDDANRRHTDSECSGRDAMGGVEDRSFPRILEANTVILILDEKVFP